MPKMWVHDSRLGAVLPGVQEPESADQWFKEAVETVSAVKGGKRKTEPEFELTRAQRTMAGLGIKVPLGIVRGLTYYAFRCKDCGEVKVSYVHGDGPQYLQCPDCLEKSTREAKKRT